MSLLAKSVARAVVIATVVLTSATLAAPTPQAVDAFVRGQMRANAVPGMAVAITSRAGTMYTQGYGLANVATREPFTPFTRTVLGSVTKSVTAILAASLAAEGRLSLDAPISSLAPNLPWRASNGAATLFQLLSHTSGLPDGVDLSQASDGMALENYARVVAASTPIGPPGGAWVYSSSGYSLAGYLLQEAGNAPFRSLIDTYVLKPLSLKHTGFSREGLAEGCLPGGRGLREHAPASGAGNDPSGMLTSSVVDFSRYLRVLADGGRLRGREVWRSSVVREVLTAAATEPDGLAYTLGWEETRVGGQAVFLHAGDVLSQGSCAAFTADGDFTVVVTANRAGKFIERTARSFLAIALGLEPIVDSPLPPDLAPVARLPLWSSLAGLYQAGDGQARLSVGPTGLHGRYSGPVSFDFDITQDGAQYVVRSAFSPLDGAMLDLNFLPDGRPQFSYHGVAVATQLSQR